MDLKKISRKNEISISLPSILINSAFVVFLILITCLHNPVFEIILLLMLIIIFLVSLGKGYWFSWQSGVLLTASLLLLLKWVPLFRQEYTMFTLWWFLPLTIPGLFLFMIFMKNREQKIQIPLIFIPCSFELIIRLFYYQLPIGSLVPFLGIRIASIILYILIITGWLFSKNVKTKYRFLIIANLVFFFCLVIFTNTVFLSFLIAPVYLLPFVVLLFFPILSCIVAGKASAKGSEILRLLSAAWYCVAALCSPG